jgi:ribosomal protein L36
MRTHKELKEFVKSLCADETDVLMDLLPSVMKSKHSNQKIIKRERKFIPCSDCGSVSVKIKELKIAVKDTYVGTAIRVFLIITTQLCINRSTLIMSGFNFLTVSYTIIH